MINISSNEHHRSGSGKSGARLALIFFVCFFTFTCSGRLGSGDAGGQLQAAMLLATTGHLSIDKSAGGDWVENPEGRFYECHDLGEIILMLPAAWVGALLSQGTAVEKFDQPPIAARFLTALSVSLLSAFASFCMFRLFSIAYSARIAFALSLAFICTTIFWAYSKTAWDVTGCACFICILIYLCTLLGIRAPSLNDCLMIGTSLAMACSFRQSVAPFLSLSTLAMMLLCRYRLKLIHWLAIGAAFGILMLPNLWYNEIRMGSILRPATTAPQFDASGTADVDLSHILQGMSGLLFSPNKGLFWYSPILLTIFAWPLVFSRTPPQYRFAGLAFGGGALLYYLFIASLRGWGAFGWGPRYLLPVVPILFLIAAIVIVAAWERASALLVPLICISLLLCSAPAIVNWHLAISEYPHAGDDPSANLPYQHMAVWSGLMLGLVGKPLPAPEVVINDQIRSGSAKFPDFWLMRLAERSPVASASALLIAVFLMAGMAFTSGRLLRET